MNVEAVRLILSKGGEKLVNQRNFEGETPLSCLCSSHSLSLQAVRLLLSHRAAADLADKKARTPLMKICEHNSPSVDCASLLLLNGAEANKNGPSGLNCFHLCLANKNAGVKFAEAIVSSVVDINEVFAFGKTYLHFACEKGVDTEKLELLINCGAKVDVRDERGEKPLYYLQDEQLRESLLALAEEVEKNVNETFLFFFGNFKIVLFCQNNDPRKQESKKLQAKESEEETGKEEKDENEQEEEEERQEDEEMLENFLVKYARKWGVDVNVATHALYVCSGDFKLAKSYIKDPSSGKLQPRFFYFLL